MAQLSSPRSNVARPAIATAQPKVSADSAPPGRTTVATFIALACAPLVALVGLNLGAVTGLRLLAVVSGVAGIAVFLHHGERRITPVGIYCLTAGLMATCGAWYWAGTAPPTATRTAVFAGALSIYTSTALMYLCFWRPPRHRRGDAVPITGPLPASRARSLRKIGVALFVVGATMQGLPLSLGGLPQSAAEVGVVFFAASLLLSGGRRVLQSPMRTFAVGGALLLYYLVVFSGYGRLRLVALAVTILVLAQYRLRTRLKPLILVGVIPALLLFGSIGQSRFNAKKANTKVQASASGLGSLVNPLNTYGELIDKKLTDGHGSTLLAESVVLVPRSVWPGKPKAFGAVIAERLHPEIAGLSMPCMPQGEWFFNFSWLGIALMIPALGFAIRWLDRAFSRLLAGPLERDEQLFRLLFIAVLVGSVADLAWGGTATWVNRNLQRMLIFVPFLAWHYIRPRESAERLSALTKPVSPFSPTQRATPAYGLLRKPLPGDGRATSTGGRPTVLGQLGDRELSLALHPAPPLTPASSTFAPDRDSADPGLPIAIPVDTGVATTGLGRRAMATVFDEALSSLQNFVVLFAALHYLRVSGIGEFTLAYTLALLAESLLKSLLLEPLTIRFSASADQVRRAAAREALGASLVAGALGGALLASPSFFAGADFRAVLLATALVLPALIVQEAWRVYFFTCGRPWRAVVNDGACFISTLVLAALLVVRPHHTSIASILLIWALGTGAGALLGCIQASFLPAGGRALSWLRVHWGLGARLAIEGGLEQAAGRLSLALIAAIAGSVALGQFAASRTIVTPVTTVIVSAITFAVPEAARLRARHNQSLGRFIAGLSVVLAGAVAIFGAAAYHLPDALGRVIAGKNWHLALKLLLPVLIWTGSIAIRQGPRVALRVFERPRDIVRLSMLTAVAVLAGTSAGATMAGSVGAAWGFGGAHLLSSGIWWLRYHRIARQLRAPSPSASLTPSVK